MKIAKENEGIPNKQASIALPFPPNDCNTSSYASTYGTSLQKIDRIIVEIRGFLKFNSLKDSRDHLGRNSLQNIVLNRKISQRERLDYIHNILLSL